MRNEGSLIFSILRIGIPGNQQLSTEDMCKVTFLAVAKKGGKKTLCPEKTLIGRESFVSN